MRLSDSYGSLVAGFLLAVTMVATGADQYTLVSSHSARVMGMGGCFAAGSDWVAAACYNPAAGYPTSGSHAPAFTLMLNPVPLLVKLENSSDSRDSWRRAFPWSLYISSLHLRFKRLALTLIPAEQLIGRTVNGGDDPWNSDLGSQETVSYLAAAYRMDDKVTLGVSLPIIWNPESGERDTGLIYGIILRPAWRMQVGLTAVDLPGGASEIRLQGDRLADNSLNAGVQYQWKLPFPGFYRMRMALDFRNVTDEEQADMSQEVHLGWELNCFHHLQLRWGLYWLESFLKQNPGPAERTLGIGLLDLQSLHWYGRIFPHPTTF
ncbi:MAG: hypothetical protein ISR91_00350, partial [Candidatus Delongbacteria bacterium]|nr:hypothetical protein [Candidatus Delongbacteria bacterium]